MARCLMRHRRADWYLVSDEQGSLVKMRPIEAPDIINNVAFILHNEIVLFGHVAERRLIDACVPGTTVAVVACRCVGHSLTTSKLFE